MYADTETTSGSIMVVGWRIRTGSTVGIGGSIIDGGEPGDGVNEEQGRLLSEGGRRSGGGGTCYVTGLTPGASYNVALYHYNTTSAGTIWSRQVVAIPLL